VSFVKSISRRRNW